MKDGITFDEYATYINHLLLQEMCDIQYQTNKLKDRFPNGIKVIKIR